MENKVPKMAIGSIKKYSTTMVQEVSMDTAIPLEKASAELLMIAGEDDHNWDSVRLVP